MAIKIDADEIRAREFQLRNFKSYYIDAINDIYCTIQALGSTEAFDSSTAAAYLDRFEKMAADFTSFEELLEDLACRLEEMAIAYTPIPSTIGCHLPFIRGGTI